MRTTSTGNIARQCFLDKHEFISWITYFIPGDYRDKISYIHTNLSAILRVYNSKQTDNTDQLEILCKNTYEMIIVDFPWVNVTPTLHKLLAHCLEPIRDCNNGRGLKEFSEEGLEACNN